MNSPLLSIIIPFYNLEHWLLKRCLESIFVQGLEEKYYEIIIIDDGSTISPKTLIEDYNKNNIFYFYQANQGLSGARNSGIKLAKGKYIQFIDSDDYLYENVTLQYIDLLERYEPDILNFKFKACYEKQLDKIVQPFLEYKTYRRGAEYMSSKEHYLPAAAWLYVFRKEIIEKNNLLFTNGIFHEDEEFTPLLYLYSGKVISINLVVYAYYQRVGSIVGRKDEDYLDIRYRDLKGVIERLQEFKEVNIGKIDKIQKYALEKKVNLLACDFILSMVNNRYPFHKLINELEYLRDRELYPLPDQKYTLKYKIFKLLVSYKLGVRMLYIIEPLRAKLK